MEIKINDVICWTRFNEKETFRDSNDATQPTLPKI